MTREETINDLFEAFSTLSDAQELATMGSPETTVEFINHAKLHLLRLMNEYTVEERREASFNSNFAPCEITVDDVKFKTS